MCDEKIDLVIIYFYIVCCFSLCFFIPHSFARKAPLTLDRRAREGDVSDKMTIEGTAFAVNGSPSPYRFAFECHFALYEQTLIIRVPTRSGKMEFFQSGNFEQTGKVRENHTRH